MFKVGEVVKFIVEGDYLTNATVVAKHENDWVILGWKHIVDEASNTIKEHLALNINEGRIVDHVPDILSYQSFYIYTIAEPCDITIEKLLPAN